MEPASLSGGLRVFAVFDGHEREHRKFKRATRSARRAVVPRPEPHRSRSQAAGAPTRRTSCVGRPTPLWSRRLRSHVHQTSVSSPLGGPRNGRTSGAAVGRPCASSKGTRVAKRPGLGREHARCSAGCPVIAIELPDRLTRSGRAVSGGATQPSSCVPPRRVSVYLSLQTPSRSVEHP